AADGTLQAVAHEDEAPAAPATAEELRSIAAQLDASAPDADAFATMRLSAAGVTEALTAALVALEDGEPSAALAATERARALHEALAAWDVGLATLAFWVETSGSLIGAVEDLAVAARDDDEPAALAAAERIGAVADEAREADLGLRIAMSEGGAAVTAAPLQRLGAVLRRVDAARAALASILQPRASSLSTMSEHR
ncbi:MAG: hypothetical protein ACRDM0_27145, partial [Thermoleophilaceae bacterium]